MKIAVSALMKKLKVALPFLLIITVGFSGVALAASQADKSSTPATWGPFPPPPAAPVFPGPFVVDIDTPDWFFEEFNLFRFTGAEAEFLNNYGEASELWAHPILWVDSSLGNSGDELSPGNTSFAHSSVQVQKPDGTTLFTGTAERWVPLSQLDDGHLACGPASLIARVPEGLLGDTNPQNDWAVAAADFIGSFDRDLRHSQNPIVSYKGPGSNYGGLGGTGTITGSFNNESASDSYVPSEFPPADEPYIRVSPITEALGNCPPLPTDGTTETYHLWTRTYLNDSLIGEVGPLPPWVAPAFELPDRLHDDDIVCVEVEIDPVEPAGSWGPSGWVLETNENNNLAVIVRQWTQHWFNGNSFNTVFHEPAFGGAGCPAIEVQVTDNATVVIVTVASGALSLGLVTLALGRSLLPRLLTAGASKAGLVVIALVGATVGGIGGSLVQGSAEATVNLRSVAGEQDALTCDRYLDPASATPGENAVVDPMQITLSLSPRADAPQPAPEDYLLKIVAPSGRESFLPAWDGPQGDKPDVFSIRDFDLNMALASVNGPGELERGPYEWSVVQGQVGAGGDLQSYSTICRGSTTHNFTLPDEPSEPPDGEEPITPTSTPSATPTTGTIITVAPSTATYTPPPPPTVAPEPADSSGPKVSGANASPNPTLTTEPVTISATVSDPSGVANVVLYYRTGKNAYTSVPMKAGGGNGYSVTIGPLTPAGSYDFRIYAVDDLGNANCDPGNVASCPGGTFQVNIP